MTNSFGNQGKTWRKFTILIWIAFLLCLPMPGCEAHIDIVGIQPPRTYAVWELLVPLVYYPWMVFLPWGLSSVVFFFSPIYPELFSAATRTAWEIKAWFVRCALITMWIPAVVGALNGELQDGKLQIGYFCLSGVYAITALATCFLQFHGPRPALSEYDRCWRAADDSTPSSGESSPPST
jgi:hypothetical protein